MAIRISAFDHTLVGKHAPSRKEVLGSIPSTPKVLLNAVAARQRLLRSAPSKMHHARYFTMFFKGSHSVIGYHELMRVSFAGFKHFLR